MRVLEHLLDRQRAVLECDAREFGVGTFIARGAVTNTPATIPYRSAGRPEATYVVERIVHQAAAEMGIPQDDLRRRNFIRTFPYQTPVALLYDTGGYDGRTPASVTTAPPPRGIFLPSSCERRSGTSRAIRSISRLTCAPVPARSALRSSWP